VSDEPHLLLDGPALVDPNRGKEKEMSVGSLEKGDPLQVVETCSCFEGL